jgi:hypothetical protein
MFYESKEHLIQDIQDNKLVLSYSSLKILQESPKAFADNFLLPRETTEAMNFGTALHTLILEPEKFEIQIVVLGDDTKGNASIAKNKKAAVLEQAKQAKQVVITKAEYEKLIQLEQMLKESELVQNLLDGGTKEEWFEQEIEGVPFCGKIDLSKPEFVLDVKTCQDCAPNRFRYTIFDYSYHLQGVMYAKVKKVQRFLILAVDKTHIDYEIIELDLEFLKEGNRLLGELLADYRTLQLGLQLGKIELLDSAKTKRINLIKY